MSWRAFVHTTCALALALLLSGCASLPFFGKKDEAPAAPEAGNDRAVYSLEVDAPNGDLRKLLLTYLDLSRFQNAPATVFSPSIHAERSPVATTEWQAARRIAVDPPCGAHTDSRPLGSPPLGST